MEALAIPQELYGQSIADSSLRLVLRKKTPKRSMLCLESVSQTKVYGQKSRCVLLCRKSLYLFTKKNQIEKDWGWRKENEKEGSINIFR